MAGIKGRSGRKSKYHELNIRQLAKMSEKSIRDCLKDTSVPIQTRATLGMNFLNKYMPDRVESQVVNMTLSEDMITRLLSFIEQSRIDTDETPNLADKDAIIIDCNPIVDNDLEQLEDTSD